MRLPSFLRSPVLTALAFASLSLAALPLGCGDPASSGDTGGQGGTGAAPTGTGAGTSATGGDGGIGGATEHPFPEGTTCIPFQGPGAPGTAEWLDGPHKATLSIADRDTCTRTYTLATTAPLRDNQPDNPRTFAEKEGQPVLRTGNDLFDALYALAVEETREASVDSIVDGAFNDGQPVPCPPGGCFETGRLWKYVWTRDTAYSLALGLASLDPTRARNSLEYKLSERRGGGDLQIVQDTGTGGSYPVSTDRVVWAMGAWELLKYLHGPEREAFLDRAYEAMKNTAEHDRAVVFDETDGLYTGEQSFLDWREQTYPAWTATDTVQIGTSKALGTNIAHAVLLDVASKIAAEKGDTSAAAQYEGWAAALRKAIHDRFFLATEGQYSTFSTTFLDQAPTRRYDLLGSAFAVLHDIATPAQAKTVVAGYPTLPRGAPVIWPQQKDTPIYHNRGLWPFVTSFWLRAARKAENARAADNAVLSLVRGAAMNLSNMENFEMVTGASWLDEGPTSGPVVCSQRQLWSVAGYLSMVHDIVFGLELSQTGIRFSPFVTGSLRESLFAGSDSIAWSGLSYRGKRVSVVVHLPPAAGGEGAYPIQERRLNGVTIAGEEVLSGDLPDVSVFEIFLAPTAKDPGKIRAVTDSDIADYRNLFAPKHPNVTAVAPESDRLRVSFDPGGESPAEIAFNVYRDGQLVAEGLPGASTSWLDEASAAHPTKSYCYTVESYYTGSGNTSQRARPFCWWGPGSNRIQTIAATSFQAQGGSLSSNHGMDHYEGWGDPGHTLTVLGFTPSFTGEHLIQLTAGNGAGPVSTGVTCGLKMIEVKTAGQTVAVRPVMMPHAGTWSEWRGSSFARVFLDKTKTYDIVIRHDDRAVNMSAFEHFTVYGGQGGKSGPFHRVNISELKLLAVDLQ
ncbi:MAG: hypothetical protein R3B70_06270 [Polyangiaceae bacterium]